MAGVINGGSILPNTLGEFIANNYNHVTVVQIDESVVKNAFEDDFVTVLQVGQEVDANNFIEELIVIYRLPGERLGMALKFEGGLNASEKINKVFIQSINSDSPASKVCGQQLEYLREGDQIMEIDGQSTTDMTRLECIGLLRDAPVCIKIRVKRHKTCQCNQSSDIIQTKESDVNLNSTSNSSDTANVMQSKENANNYPRKVPPPVPPRLATTILSSKRKIVTKGLTRTDSQCDAVEKPPRKRSSLPPPLPPRRPKVPPPKPPNHKTNTEANATNDLFNKITKNEINITANQTNANKLEVNDCQIVEGVVFDTNLGHNYEKQPENTEDLEKKNTKKSNESVLPSEADVYLNLLTDEDKLLIESESDDTGSSVSTIIERFSRTSTANSSFSDHNKHKTPTIDIVGRVLSPFEKLERELDHKEALQAFVNNAVSVLMNDEDLRQITDQSLCNATYFMNYEDSCEKTSSLDCYNSINSNTNCNANEIQSNVQIIVPPEEFANDLKLSPQLMPELVTRSESENNTKDSDISNNDVNRDIAIELPSNIDIQDYQIETKDNNLITNHNISTTQMTQSDYFNSK
ncbi:beclin-1-like protein A [Oppia nitens]|uniref:beclin-1-like protein A n=1 Tax=Oppia nitens TaxID=1686743 RepID=UPI0023DA0CFB|nr:beclin-1-like protein A [Oppia nitens]